jgi:hypothetical protein
MSGAPAQGTVVAQDVVFEEAPSKKVVKSRNSYRKHSSSWQYENAIAAVAIAVSAMSVGYMLASRKKT